MNPSTEENNISTVIFKRKSRCLHVCNCLRNEVRDLSNIYSHFCFISIIRILFILIIGDEHKDVSTLRIKESETESKN